MLYDIITQMVFIEKAENLKARKREREIGEGEGETHTERRGEVGWAANCVSGERISERFNR